MYFTDRSPKIKNAKVLRLLWKQNSRIIIVLWLARAEAGGEGGWDNVFCAIKEWVLVFTAQKVMRGHRNLV